MFVIAGVTGHVGSVAAKDLLSKKQPVKAIVRDGAKGAQWAKEGAELAVGSLDDRAFLTAALRGTQGFFTLLPPPPFTTQDFFAAQRKTADAIAGAVKDSGVPHVVLLSSLGADLAEGTGPIKGLHYLENALRAAGTKLTSIRAAYFQENVGNSIAAARSAGIFPNFNPSADYAMPTIATRDIGMLAAKSLVDSGGKSEIIDLIGPSYSIRQIAERLGRALGKTLKVVDVPQTGWIGALMQAGMPQPIAEVFAEMYAGFASGKIAPRGDRVVQGKTDIDEVLKTLV